MTENHELEARVEELGQILNSTLKHFKREDWDPELNNECEVTSFYGARFKEYLVEYKFSWIDRWHATRELKKNNKFCSNSELKKRISSFLKYRPYIGISKKYDY